MRHRTSAARLRRPSVRWLPAAAALIAIAGCRGVEPAAAERPTPVYDESTGRLKELVSDRNGDGRPDFWAYMDGARIERIEMDRTGDGRIDRWEHYGPLPPGAALHRRLGQTRARLRVARQRTAEADIAAAETRLREVEQLLASPDLYREGGKVKDVTDEFEALKQKLQQLYEHWEEAVELN